MINEHQNGDVATGPDMPEHGSALAAVEADSLVALAPALETAAGLARESRSPRTRSAYRYQWEAFMAWCDARGADALPAKPAVLAAYVADRATVAGWKVATLGQALSAISYTHRMAGLPSPVGHPMVAATWEGARRTLGTAQRRAAPAVVSELCSMIGGLALGRLVGLRDRALLTTGFAGAFRRSELVALDVADLTFTNDGLVVAVLRSKTDQEGAGATVGLPFGGNPETCPVRSMRAWLEASNTIDGAVFRAVNRHGCIGPRLAGADVSRIVKRCAARAGLDARRYSGHSLRAGLATSAASAGKSDRAIMAQGRWRSRAMVDRYVRDASLFRVNAAAGIGL